MKKLLPFLLIFAVLGAIAAYFILGDKKATTISDREFAYPEVSNIGKIVVHKVGWNPQTFVHKNGRWYVNDYLVADYKMSVLLKGITSTRIENLPPKNGHQTIFESIKNNGVQVKVYSKNEQLLRNYTIGPDALNDRCTYFVMDGSNQPYCMNIAGFGTMRTRFVQELERWRDVAIYNEPIENITSVKVEYNKDYTNSFQIVRKSGAFDVIDIGNKTEGRAININKVRSYLSGFQPLNGEGYDNGYIKRDSIRNLLPFATISLTNTSGKSKSIKLFPVSQLIDPQDEIYDAKDALLIEKYFVETSDGDFMVAQQRLLKAVLRPYDYFLGD